MQLYAIRLAMIISQEVYGPQLDTHNVYAMQIFYYITYTTSSYCLSSLTTAQTYQYASFTHAFN